MKKCSKTVMTNFTTTCYRPTDSHWDYFIETIPIRVRLICASNVSNFLRENWAYFNKCLESAQEYGLLGAFSFSVPCARYG